MRRIIGAFFPWENTDECSTDVSRYSLPLVLALALAASAPPVQGQAQAPAAGAPRKPATVLRLWDLECGDLDHVPRFNFNQEQSHASMNTLKALAEKEHAEVWINHEKMVSDKIPKRTPIEYSTSSECNARFTFCGAALPRFSTCAGRPTLLITSHEVPYARARLEYRRFFRPSSMARHRELVTDVGSDADHLPQRRVAGLL